MWWWAAEAAETKQKIDVNVLWQLGTKFRGFRPSRTNPISASCMPAAIHFQHFAIFNVEHIVLFSFVV
jgi:hypothetical protein